MFPRGHFTPCRHSPGDRVGASVGDTEGASVGDLVGESVGFGVGDLVGAGVHSCVLQSRSSKRAGQADPPHEEFVVMVRVRLCVPPPQDLVHVPQAPKPDTAQFTLQHWVLHV